MLDDKKLEKAIKSILKRLGKVNTLYIRKIATQIKKIGELSQSSVNAMVEMLEMGANVAEINQALQMATLMNSKDIYALYQQVLDDTYTDPRFADYLKNNPLPEPRRQRIARYANAVARQTAGSMVNLSNTTVVSQTYRNAVDLAILTVGSGVGDYKSAIRGTIKDIGQAGMQVRYPSGYHRRLDTAVRQNVIDGAKQIAVQASFEIGEHLGFDAVELSAHARPAPDHAPVQGRIFLNGDYEMMQIGSPFRDIDGKVYGGFRRPIGEWNCMHIPTPFSTEFSIRRFTPEQLDAFNEENEKGCIIGKKHYTTYQASQLMRQIETQIRREKDTAVAAQAAEDDELRADCQKRINALAARYTLVSKASGVAPRRDRMMVAGFKRAKTNQTSPK